MEGSFVVSRKYENKLDIKTRKERGIYYTPYVVVKYILDNTIGKHDIVQNPYPKILDMSCGCGNFLIQAYTMLYKKFYDNIDKLNQRYGQDFICKEDIGLHIIKNCIFGVDTDNDALMILENELKKILKKELRETYKHKPLIRDDDLDEILDEEYLDKLNIFCGDSLKNDLSEVFGVDKFDYIIGNPPYVGQKYLDNDYKKFLYKEFEEVYKNKGDLYFCFYKKILDLLRQDGKSGIITPRYFMQSPSGKYLRSYLVNNSQIEKIIDFLGANLFTGLGVASCIVIFGHKIETDNKNNCLELYKIKNENINIKKIANLEDYINKENFKKINVEIDSLGDTWLMVEQAEFEFYNKIQNKCEYFLEEICESFQGIITGCDKAFVVDKNDKNLQKINGKFLKKWIKNKDIGKYIINNSQSMLIYSNDIKNEEEEEFLVETFLKPYKQKLQNRRECRRNYRKWYELQWGREKYLFEQKKIMYPYKSRSNKFAIDIDNTYGSADIYSFYIKDEYKNEFSYEYLVGLLNSKTYDKYFKIIGKEMGKKVFDYYPNKIMKLKIFKDENYDEIEALSKEVVSLSRQKIMVSNELNTYINECNGKTVEKLTISTVQGEFKNNFLEINGYENVAKIQDKKISLLKEKNYLEKKIDFIENKIDERIKKSLNL